MAAIYLAAWKWIKIKQLDKNTEQRLWLVVRRVAYHHNIVLPDGISLDDAGTYVEQQLDDRRGEPSKSEMRISHR